MAFTCYYCDEKPNKAPPGYKSIWCKKHANPTKSIHSDRIRCNIQRCKKIPKYEYAGKTIPMFCYLHKEQNMIDITATVCIYADCKKKSVLGGIDNIPKYCRQHATINSIDSVIEIDRCAYVSCRDLPDQKYKFIFCKKHFIEGNPETCLLCTMLVVDKLYCNHCNDYIIQQTNKLFDSIDMAATEYRLVSNAQETIDPLLKPQIDFSIKLDYVPVEFLLNQLDLLDNTFDFNNTNIIDYEQLEPLNDSELDFNQIDMIDNNTFDFNEIHMLDEQYTPYTIYDHIDIPDI